jgi:hypothetical protein
MIRAGLYTISAAAALASNVFLLSLLVLPDRTPVQSHLWPRPAYECHGHRTIQLSKDFRFQLPKDPHPRLANGAARLRNRILASKFQSPVPVDPELVTLEDRSYIEDIKLESVIVELQKRFLGDSLGQDTDGKRANSVSHLCSIPLILCQSKSRLIPY